MKFPPPPPPRFGRLLLAGICCLGLAIAQTLDVALTASGLVFLDVALAMPVLGRWGMAIGMALVLQSTVLAGDLVLANAGGVRHGRRGATALMLAID